MSIITALVCITILLWWSSELRAAEAGSVAHTSAFEEKNERDEFLALVHSRAATQPQMDHARLTHGELARRSKATLRTVRFYEQEGLLVPIVADGGNTKKFPPSELRKLELLVALRGAGLSLPQLKQIFLDRSKGVNVPESAAAALEAAALDLEQRLWTVSLLLRKLRGNDRAVSGTAENSARPQQARTDAPSRDTQATDLRRT